MTRDETQANLAGRPFVTVKYAQTLDGRLATATGDSQWISGPESLKLAHRLRSEHDAIMVGVGTVIADNPRLNVRLVEGPDPRRVIVDTRLRIPADAQVLAGEAARGTLIATTELADAERLRQLRARGAEVVVLPMTGDSPQVDLAALLDELGRRGDGSVLVEGGARIVTSLLAQGLVDRLVVAIAPKLVGSGLEAVGDLGIRRLADALTFTTFTTYSLGSDLIFDGRTSFQNRHTE